MSAENLLTADQFAALSPGDTATIETADVDRQPTLTTGRGVRIAPGEFSVSTPGLRRADIDAQRQLHDAIEDPLRKAAPAP